MTVYIPSCVTNLTIAFDESLTLVTGQPLLGSVDTAVKAGGNPPASSALPGKAAAFSKSNNSFILNRVPKKASVELPGFRQAGTFSLTFDYREFPIDPRTVRSATANIHLGTVNPTRFAQGISSLAAFSQTRPSILDTTNFFGLPQDETLIMTGYVDNWRVVHGSSGSEVTISGRDSRAPLLDTPIGGNPKLQQSLLEMLDYGLPIHLCIKKLLEFHQFFKDFPVEIDINEWPNGKVPSPAEFGLTTPRHRQGAKGDRKHSRVNPPGTNSSTTFWDLIVRLCFLVGAVPYMTGTQLIIRPVRRLYDQQRAGIDPRVQSPFRNGTRSVDAATGATIKPLKVRRLVYGRDIEELSFDRKFGGFAKPKVVRAIGGDDTAGKKGNDRVIMELYPAPDKTAARRSRVSPSGKEAQEDFLDYPCPGIRDRARLQAIAQSIYEELGRGEVGGSVSTPNLASFGGDNTEPDLLQLKPGDAVEIKVDAQVLRSVAPVVSTFIDHNRTDVEALITDIAKRIGSKDLARVLVSTSRNQVQELISFFRVSSVSYSWDCNRGASIDFDFQNYVGRYQGDPDDQSTVAPVFT